MNPKARVVRVALIALAAGFVVWTSAAVFALKGAKDEVDAGRGAIDRARVMDAPEDFADGRPVPLLRQASKHFDAALARTRSAWLAPARLVPVLGRQIRSASALAAAARTVASAGADGIEEARRIFDLPHGTGPERVAIVRKATAVAHEITTRIDGLDLGPARGLIRPLAKGRADIQAELADLRQGLTTATMATTAVADLLEGPRTYLVFGANNAEMRAGSGMFLTIAELHTSGGNLSLGPTRAAEEIPIPRGRVPVSGDIKDRWAWAGVTNNWTNLMLSPRFDENASLAAKMWVAAGHTPIDGVIAIDPAALKAIVAATGPIKAGGRTISADSIEEELLHAQYVRFADQSPSLRREALGAIAHGAFEGLNNGGWDPAKLLKGFAESARRRHMMIWSPDASAQRAWHEAGIDGTLREDSLLVSVLNRGGNKLDRFLEVEADLDVRPKGNFTDVALTLTLRNTTPAGEPGYVAGPYPGLGTKAGDYLGIVAVSLPGAAGDISIDGAPALGVNGRDGPSWVTGLQIKIARGASRTLVLRFRFSGGSGSFRVEPSARVPATRWNRKGDSWKDDDPEKVSWP